MKYIFGIMLISAVVFGIATGNIDNVANAVLSEGTTAVTLVISIAGGICFWGGMMRIVEKTNLAKHLATLFRPLIKILFSELDPKGDAAGKISMNLVANFLGLGNAATPLGIAAMIAMDKEQGARGRASNSMVLFVVMNTASFQLVPTTTAMIRQSMGALQPFDILPSVWLASFVSVSAGIICTKVFAQDTKGRYRK